GIRVDGYPGAGMNVGVVQFPGSNDERDAVWAVKHLGGEAQLVWHGARSLGDIDALILPGGFSYGDYLRCGAIARFANVMPAVVAFARALSHLQDSGQIVCRYSDIEGRSSEGSNPNGATDAIAGVCNEAGNVLGMMPHPEHAVDPAVGFYSGDGAAVIGALLKRAVRV